MIIVVAYCCYSFVNQQREIYAVQQEAAAVKNRVEQLQQLNQSYTDEKNRLGTPAYLEQLAREQLGLVKPGEVPYVPAEKK
jgi:cell division protein FtsL